MLKRILFFLYLIFVVFFVFLYAYQELNKKPKLYADPVEYDHPFVSSHYHLNDSVHPLLKVYFNGSFSGNNYLPTPDEIVDGNLLRGSNLDAILHGNFELTSNSSGLNYLPKKSNNISPDLLHQNLIIEVVGRSSKQKKSGASLINALNSIFYRYEANSNMKMEIGLEDVSGLNKSQLEVSSSSYNYQHISLVYTFDNKAPTVSLYVNGCFVSKVTANQIPSLTNITEVISFGGKDSQTSWQGQLDAISAATFNGNFSPADFFQILPGISYPSSLVPISQCDTPDTLVLKAANTIPSDIQKQWQQQELTAFLHFGINTFTGKEWGDGTESPVLFNPTDLDAGQWMKNLNAAGFKQAIIVSKHLDGFSLWPSRYTAYSVKSSPWKNSAGDVIREVATAARNNGIKLGIYYGLIDLHELNRPGGTFGDNSPVVKSVIPTLLPNDTRKPSQFFTYDLDNYQRFMMNQLYELLTENGPISEVWFDTAGPPLASSKENFNYEAIFDLVHHLAPNAVTFLSTVRWVGNETGEGRPNEWSVVPLKIDPTVDYKNPDNQLYSEDIGSRTKWEENKYFAWYPAEVDTSIRPHWFYLPAEDSEVKSLDTLKDFYYNSVGRNGNALLNVPPDKRGLFTNADNGRLNEFGNWLKQAFQNDLARGSFVTSTNITPDPLHPESNLVDSDPNTYWQMDDYSSSGTLTFTLNGKKTVNRILLQESLDFGQRIESYKIEYWNGLFWKSVEVQSSPTNSSWPTDDPHLLSTVGYKRIIRIKTLTTNKIRLKILGSRLNPALSTFSLFYDPS